MLVANKTRSPRVEENKKLDSFVKQLEALGIPLINVRKYTPSEDFDLGGGAYHTKTTPFTRRGRDTPDKYMLMERFKGREFALENLLSLEREFGLLFGNGCLILHLNDGGNFEFNFNYPTTDRIEGEILMRMRPILKHGGFRYQFSGRIDVEYILLSRPSKAEDLVPVYQEIKKIDESLKQASKIRNLIDNTVNS